MLRYRILHNDSCHARSVLAHRNRKALIQEETTARLRYLAFAYGYCSFFPGAHTPSYLSLVATIMGICSSKVANPSGDAGIRGLQDPMTSTGSTSSAVPDYSIHILTHSLHRSLATFHNGHVYRVTPLLFFAECTLHARAQYPVQLRFQDRAVTIGCCATCWQPRITLFCGGELNIALPDPTVHANYHRLDSGNAGPIAVPQ